LAKTVTANRLGGGGYFYNRWLAVIEEITDGFITAFQFGFWTLFAPILDLFWVCFSHFGASFSADMKSKSQNKSKQKYKYKYNMYSSPADSSSHGLKQRKTNQN